MSDFSNEMDQLLSIFILETKQLLESLESIMLEVEENDDIPDEHINEIFRTMHTVKGSAAMMSYDNISKVAHRIEDLFFKVREDHSTGDKFSEICDIVFDGADFIKSQIEKLEEGEEANDTADELIEHINAVLAEMNGEAPPPAANSSNDKDTKTEEVVISAKASSGKYKYMIHVQFEADCKMENVRAFSLLNELENYVSEVYTRPIELFADDSSAYIVEHGFDMYICTDLEKEEVESRVTQQMCIDKASIELVDDYSDKITDIIPESMEKKNKVGSTKSEEKKKTPVKTGGVKQNFVNVNVEKLNVLMDLVGEIVISSSMVVQSPDLAGLELNLFHKRAEQMTKLTRSIQDVVMSMRMVPIAAAFQKMHRIVRDMSKNLNKDVELVIEGEETEVDKSIIDHLSDPLMHMVRNCMDHGIETAEERALTDKPAKGRVTLKAVNTGSNVVVTVSDDGKGLDRNKIIKKAIEKGVLTPDQTNIPDKQAFACILAPGFSTKEQVTEYSGRGVGMDVVKQNIESLGGTVEVESEFGKGTSMIITIPLTLAIIDGMNVKVGNSVFIIPIESMVESFKANSKDIFEDPVGNEMILIRGNCYDIVRLHELYGIDSEYTDFEDGIFITVEGDGRLACLFVDSIIGEQQIVIKPLPGLIGDSIENYSAISGCTILADGSVGFILNTHEY